MTVTVADDDEAPEGITLKASITSIDEDAATATVRVTASVNGGTTYNAATTVAVTVGDSDDTATEGTDYVEVAGKTITIKAGAASGHVDFSLDPTDDVLAEGDEDLSIGGTSGSISITGTSITIDDDDAAPSGITLEADPFSVAENAKATTVKVTATVNGDTRYTDAKTVRVSVGGGTATVTDDYAAVPAFDITIAAGAASAEKTFTLTPADDGLYEGSETIDVTGVSGTLTISKDQITLTDDDAAPTGLTLTVDTDTTEQGAQAEVAEDGGAVTVRVTAKLAGTVGFDEDKTIAVAVGRSADTATEGASGDYQTVADLEIELEAGDTKAHVDFTLTPVDDAADELDETISVRGTLTGVTVTHAAITLTDDDVPVLSIADGAAVTEGTAATFRVTSDIAPAAALTVNLAVTQTGAFAGSADLGNKTLTFPRGATHADYDVDTAADNTDEADGAVTVTLRAGTDYTVHASDNVGRADVNDNDATRITLARSGTGAIAEAGGTADITVTLGRALAAGETVTVPLTVSGGVHGTHFTLGLKGNGGTGVSLLTKTPHSAANPAVELSGAAARVATLLLTAKPNKDTDERTVAIAFGSGQRAPDADGLSAGGVTASGSASVVIADDDAMITVRAASAAEGGSVAFTVTLPEAAPAGGVTVNYATSDGRGDNTDKAYEVATAGASGDYTRTRGTLTIAATKTTGTVSVPTRQDSTYEGDHHFTLTLSRPSRFNVSTASSVAVGTITDADDTPAFNFSAASSTVAENVSAGTVTLTVNRTGATEVPATLSYQTADVTATAGDDYTAIAATALTYAANATSATFTVSLDNDTTDEPSETFTVTLAATAHAKLGATATHTVTITDDDAAPTLSVGDATAVDEGDDPDAASPATLAFTVDLSAASGKDVTVPYTLGGTATAGTDYATPNPRSLTIDAGSASADIEIEVIGDELHEPDETVTVTLGAPTNATISSTAGAGAGSGIITDDEATPTVTLNLSRSSINESGSGNSATVTADLTGATSKALTLTVSAAAVSPAQAGDFTLSANKELTIAAGRTASTGTVTITAVDNSVDADNKSVTVSAAASGGNGVGNPANVSLTIADDDAAPGAIALTADIESIAENAATKTVTVTATIGGATTYPDATTVAVTVGATADSATEGTDYARVNGFDIVIAAEKSSATGEFSLNPTDDRLAEGSESFSITGSSGTLTVNGDSITITDNDERGVVLTPASFSIAEADNGATRDAAEHKGTYTVKLASEPTGAVTIDLDVPDGAPFTVNPTSLDFDDDDWNSPQTVTVTARDDDLDNAGGGRTAIIGHDVDADGTDYEDETAGGVTVTVTDDDVPVLSIGNGAAVTEGTAAEFEVTADIAPAAALTVNLAVAQSGAFVAAGKLGNKTVTLAKGATSADYSVDTIADTVDEADGAVTVSLSAGTGYTVHATDNSGKAAVNDDDKTSVTLARSGSGPIAEDGGTADITVTLGRKLVAGETVTVPLTVTGATHGTHFTLGRKGDGGTGVSLLTATPHSAANPAVRLSGADALKATLALTASSNNDTVERSVAIALGTGARAPTSTNLSGGISASGSASVAIADDDAMVTVAAASAAEGSAVEFTVTLPEAAPAGGVTVDYATSDGRGINTDAAYQVATAGTSGDYTEKTGTLTIAATRNTGTVSVTTRGDSTYEGDHHFRLTLSNPSKFNVNGASNIAVGTITDAADKPAFGFSAASSDVDEDVTGGTHTLTVNRTGATLVPATISYKTADGTATGGDDYTAIAATNLAFAAADTSKTFTVSITDDSTHEPDETFTATLTVTDHAKLGATATHTVTIEDDEALPTASLTLTPAAINESGNGNSTTVTASLTGASSQAVTLAVSATPVSPAAAGDVSVSANTDLTISAGETASTGAVTIAAVDNKVDTPDKTVTVSAAATGGNGVANPAAQTLTIRDDDARRVSVSTAALSIRETDDGSTRNVMDHQDTYEVVLASEPSGDVTITVNVPNGAPFTADQTSLAFDEDNWDDAQEVTVTARNDDIDNAGNARSAVITHGVSAAGTDYATETATSVTVTVNDDDGAPTGIVLSVDADTGTNGRQTGIDEGGGAKTVRVTATPAGARFDAAKTVTLTIGKSSDGATSGTDYAAVTGKTITLAKGAASGHVDFTLTPTDDDFDENDESISIDGAVAGVTVTGASVTLEDDDTRGVTVAPTSLALAEADDAGTATAKENEGTYTVKLNSRPTGGGNVGIGLSTGENPPFRFNPANLSFTGSTWNTAQTVTVTAIDDSTDNPGNARSANIVHTLSAGGTDYASGVSASNVAVTVNDDDGPPTGITLTASPSKVAEDVSQAPSVSVKATVTGGSAYGEDKTVRVTVGASGDSATSGIDYAAVTAFDITIAAGDRSADGSFTLTPTDDDFAEGDETISIEGASPNLSVTNTSITLTDDDKVGIVLSPKSLTIDEVDNDGTVGTTENSKTYGIRLASQPVGGTGNVRVNIAAPAGVASVSPTHLDFTAATWKTAQNVRVTAIDDQLDNDGDKRTGTIAHSFAAAGTNYHGESADGLTVTVNDDEGTPTLTINAPSVAEGAAGATATLAFTVTLAPASDRAVTVAYADAGTGTATSGTDYTAIAGATLSFAAGQTGKTVDVTVRGDALNEGNETVKLRLSSPVNAALSGGGTALDGTGTITDDDPLPVVTIDAPSVTEGAANTTATLTFTVTLTPASGREVRVAYADAGTGTATSGTDYTAIAGATLSFAAGQTSKTVDVTVRGDALDEANETVKLRLSSAVNATLSGGGATLDGEGTITDDEGTPTVSLVLSRTAIDERGAGNSATVTATLSADSSEALELMVAAAPGASGTSVIPAATGDFTLGTNKKLTIAAGSRASTGTVTITAVDNDIDTTNKSIAVSATVMGGHEVAAPAVKTLTITDDDTRGIDVSPTSLTLAEADNTNTADIKEHQGSYDVVLTSEPTGTVTISVASDDTDAGTVNKSSLTFDDGDWNDAQTVTVTAVPDAYDNTGDKRSLSITHTVSASGTDYSGESADDVGVEVTDDDDAPMDITLSVDTDSVTNGSQSSIAENAAATTVAVKAALSGDARFAEAKTISVSVGATGDSAGAGDYAAVADFDLVINAGQREGSASFTLTPTNDVIHEGDESLSVTGTLSGVTIAPASITLTDNDKAPTGITLSVNPSSVAEDVATAPKVTVTASVTGGTTYGEEKTVTVTVGDADDSAAEGTDYATVADFSIKIGVGAESATGSFTLTPTDDSLNEDAETISVTGSASGVATLTGTELELVSDDGEPVLSITGGSVDEGDSGTATLGFTVDLSPASGKRVTVAYADVAAGAAQATAGSDYTAVSGTLAFAPGETRKTVDVSVTGDAIDEADETVTLRLSSATNATFGGTATTLDGGGAIEDDDTAGVHLSASALEVRPDETATYQVRLTSEPESQVRVTAQSSVPAAATLSVGGGTPAAAVDLDFNSGNWQTPRTVTVHGLAEAENQADVSISHTLDTSAASYSQVTAASVTTAVIEGPTIRLETDYGIFPEGTTHEFRFIASETAERDVQIHFEVRDEAADFLDPSDEGMRTVMLREGADRATVHITTVVDHVDEPTDFIEVILRDGRGYRMAEEHADRAVWVQTNDDLPPVEPPPGPEISMSAGAAVTEGAKAAFTLTADPAPEADLDINLLVSEEGDFVAAGDLNGRFVTFAAGSATKTVEIDTLPDSEDEADGAVVLALSSGEGYSLSSDYMASVPVRDDDATRIELRRSGGGAIAENGGVADIHVSLGRALVAGEAVTVPLDVSGATESDHFTLALAPGGSGVSLDTGNPHSAQNPALVFSGAGARSATLRLTALPNTDTESRTVSLAFASGSRAPSVTSGLSGGIALRGGPLSLPIADDEAEITVASAQVAEGGELQFNVTLPEPAPTGGVTVDYETLDGRGEENDATHRVAVGGVDYASAAADASITIAEGATSGTIAVATLEDAVYEDDHYMRVRLTSASSFALSTGGGTAVGLIDDRADVPVFAFTEHTGDVDEAAGTATLTVTRAGEAAFDTGIDYRTVDGDAEAGSDYASLSGSLVFASDETQKTLAVALTDDELDEPRESFRMMLTAGDEGAVGDIPECTLVIVDDDATEVSVRMTQKEVDEAGAAAKVTVELGRALGAGETIEVALKFGGDAQFGVDYILKVPDRPPDGVSYLSFDSDDAAEDRPTVRFSGDGGAPAAAPFLLSALSDLVEEDSTGRGHGRPDGKENGWIGIHGLTDGTEVDGGATDGDRADFTIIDELPQVPVVALSGPDEIVEGEDMVLTLKTDMASDSDYEVNLFVSQIGAFLEGVEEDGSNYYGVTVGAGETSATLAIATADDDAQEGDGEIHVLVTSSEDRAYEPADGEDRIQVAIRDNDISEVTITAGPAVTEGGDAEFTIHASPPFPSRVDIEIHVSGSLSQDEHFGWRRVAGPAGASSVELRIATRDDDYAGENRPVKVRLDEDPAYRVGSPSEAEVRVLDNDAKSAGSGARLAASEAAAAGLSAVSLSAPSVRVAEGESLTVVARLSRPLDRDARIPLAVAGGSADASDYDLGADSAEVRIATGETAGEVRIPITDDVLDEPDETLRVLLGALPDDIVPGTPREIRFTLEDNDEPPEAVALAVEPRSTPEDGGPATVRVTATVQGATRFGAARDVRVVVGMAGDRAEPGADYAPVPAFSVTIPAGADLGGAAFLFAPAADGADEGDEALTVAGELEGVRVVAATLLIADGAPAPRADAWLGHFGRVVAEQLVEDVGDRLAADRAPGRSGALGGLDALRSLLPVPPADPESDNGGDRSGPESAGRAADTAENGTGTDLGARQTPRGRAGVADDAPAGFDAFVPFEDPFDDGPFGQPDCGIAATGGMATTDMSGGGARMPMLGPQATPGGSPTGAPGALIGPRQSGMGGNCGSPLASPTLASVLEGTSFAMVGKDGRRALWGGGAWTDFNASRDGRSLSGGVATGALGADWLVGDRLLAGVLVSQSEARGERTGGDGGSLALSSGLTTVAPYAGYEVSARMRVWGLAGVGAGETRIAATGGGEPLRLGTGIRLVAVGGRGDLLGGDSGFALAAKGDALVVSTRAETDGRRSGGAASARRLRLAMEGSWRREMAGGRSLRAQAEAGLRRDAGDAVEGLGAEASAGIFWEGGVLALGLEGRRLVAHEASGLDQFGLSASASWDPTPNTPLGPTLSLRQGWGIDTRSGIESLFGGPDAAGFGAIALAPAGLGGAGSGFGAHGGGLELEAGWGHSLFRKRILAHPKLLFAVSEAARRYGLAWQISSRESARRPLALELELTLQDGAGHFYERDDAPATEYGASLGFSFAW
ncbi:MAG: hypothetical protein OXG47_06825 [bacterium]|nr:hypothetical protein [bacterium]